MNFQQNVSLLQYNTFHIQAKAAHYCEFKNVEDLREALKWMNEKKIHDPLVLGGGSNILLTRDVEFVMANRISGFEVCQETNEDVIVKAGAGLNWHQFVLECIQKGYGGIENLSLIPGNVGASPMQNIGAYGVEIKDVFHELEAVEISSGDIIRMNNQECEFGYRESVFKNKYRNRFVITSVSYKLSKVPVVNTSYGAIEEELGKMEISSPGIKDVSNAVINIRQSKLI